MQNKKIIDIISIDNKEGFVLKLDNIEEIADSFNLSPKEVIKDGYYYLEKSNFTKAKAYCKLYWQMVDNGEGIYNLVDIINGKEIIYKFKNEENTIESTWSILNLIKNFYSTISRQTNLISDNELKDIISDVETIRKNIMDNLLNIVNNINLNDINIRQFKILENIKYNYKLEIDIFKVKEQLNKKIKEIKIFNRKLLMEILEGVYTNNFLTSKEFDCFLKENNNIRYENYDDLLKNINESYLIYRYNLESKTSLSPELIIDLDIYEYFNLPIVYREFLLKQINEKNIEYRNINELKKDINMIIDEIRAYNITAIPV